MCLLRWFWIQLPGTRRLAAQHYTHARPLAQFEIFIPWICFSDAPFLAALSELAGKLLERFPWFDPLRSTILSGLPASV
jgi:hypothetical protein